MKLSGLKLDIPVFMQVPGKDESTPAESTFLVPLEFMRAGKSNLTYKICNECDHGFTVENDKGQIEDRWSEIFSNFLQWTKENVR